MSLSGRRILVSAGPTYEDIDPVRFIGNRSSGKMGFAIAAAAARRGAQVVLVAGPVALATPQHVTRIDVRSAAQMRSVVFGQLPADVYIGAAAVADFTPSHTADHKLKKKSGTTELVLALVRTYDILAEIAVHALRPSLVVGFAAETKDLESSAKQKRIDKRIDVIAANQVGVAGRGFESDENALTVYWNDGERVLGPAMKVQLADDLLNIIEERLSV